MGFSLPTVATAGKMKSGQVVYTTCPEKNTLNDAVHLLMLVITNSYRHGNSLLNIGRRNNSVNS
jgi:hypothetical protein